MEKKTFEFTNNEIFSLQTALTLKKRLILETYNVGEKIEDVDVVELNDIEKLLNILKYTWEEK